MKRQRYVYPTDRIAHLWAHQTQSEARNPGRNFYFRGDTIYSYGTHFPIARHVKHRGKLAILLTSRTYSVTTAGHINLVRQAIPPGVPKFIVANPAGTLTDAKNGSKQSVEIAQQSLAAAKSKPQQAIRYRSLVSVIADANRFNEFFGYKARYALPKNYAELEAIATAYEAALDQRREARYAKQRERWAAIEAEREKQRAERAAKMPELIQRWHAGENCISHWEAHDFPTLLRINGDEIETSRGASFPVDHALRVLPVVQSLIQHGRTYQRNGHSIHLGHYVLDRVDSDGTIHAGCHVVRRDETERLIQQLKEQTPCDCKSN